MHYPIKEKPKKAIVPIVDEATAKLKAENEKALANAKAEVDTKRALTEPQPKQIPKPVEVSKPIEKEKFRHK